jgi:Cu/Ag efflux protein CusF
MKFRSLCSGANAAAIVCAALMLPTALPQPAAAQANPTMANVVPESVAVTIHAKIQTIDPSSREVTLQGRSGNSVTVTVGPMVRLDLLKVGDTVNAKYYRSVAFELSRPQPGNAAPESNDQMTQITAQPVQAPGGVGVRLTKVSGLVVGMDMAAHSIDVVNPSGGGVYTINVTDPARIAMLSQLKVGDTITAVVSQALAVSIDPAPKSWF